MHRAVFGLRSIDLLQLHFGILLYIIYVSVTRLIYCTFVGPRHEK